MIGESMVAIVLARALQEKFGGDTLQEVQGNLESYLQTVHQM